MEIAPALLEYWMRDYYFDTEIDIGSSGVENFSLAEIRELINLTSQELDCVTFRDSQTFGNPELRKVIAERWGNGNPEWVMTTHGSSEAIYLIMNALLNAGDEVVILTPCYQQLFTIAESIGCRMKSWSLEVEQQFVPNIEKVKSLIRPETRMVVVNFPHNPTGVSLTLEEQEILLRAAEEVECYLVWDAAFADLTYDCPPLPCPSLQYHRAISIGTLSKAYGLPGLRVGWLIASPSVLAQCARLRDYITLHLSPLVELIAQRVIEKASLLLNLRLKQAHQNLEILTKWISQREEIAEWARPQGGVCTFLRLCGIPDIEAFCHRLARTYGVLLVPGTCFQHSDHIRLGFGGRTLELKEGLSRFERLLTIDAIGRE